MKLIYRHVLNVAISREMTVLNNKGYMTIEASFIIPLILMGIFMCLFGLILVYEKGVIYSSQYAAVYSVPINNIRNDSIEAYLDSKDYSKGVLFGSLTVDTYYSSHKAGCDGQLSLYGTHQLSSIHEVDARTERLRRWQFYGDTYEKYGD